MALSVGLSALLHDALGTSVNRLKKRSFPQEPAALAATGHASKRFQPGRCAGLICFRG
jgi:hypothetical protein